MAIIFHSNSGEVRRVRTCYAKCVMMSSHTAMDAGLWWLESKKHLLGDYKKCGVCALIKRCFRSSLACNTWMYWYFSWTVLPLAQSNSQAQGFVFEYFQGKSIATIEGYFLTIPSRKHGKVWR